MTDPTPRTPGVPNELLIELLESSPDLLCIAGADGRFAWVAPAWERVFGWTREELMSRPFVDFVHPDDLERTLAKARAMYERGDTAATFENRYRTRDGEYRWLQWNGVVGTGNVLHSVARDVTDLKRRQQDTQEQMRLLAMSEEVAGICHWRVDVDAGRPHWSPGVFEIHGLDPADGEPDLEAAIEVYHPDDRPIVERAVSEAIEFQRPFEFTARLIRPDGEVREVESNGVPEVDLNGRVVALFGIFRDITERRRVEDTLRRTRRMVSIGTMAAGITHEINNPLSYLIGNLQLIREELDALGERLPAADVAELQEMIDDSIAGGHRVRKIVNGMRAFSRVGQAESSVVNVAEAVHSAVAIAEHEVRLRARLVVDGDRDLHVLASETQLVQVLVNLLMNAAQALPEGRASQHSIRLSVDADEDEIRIRVVDSGEGVPREVRDRIFDPFFTTKPVGSGTGLGLSICHSILDRFGGSIELEDTESGASFLIRLPRHRDPAAEEVREVENTAAADAPAHASATLLVIDDEPQVRELLRRALRRQFTVEVAGSGSEALRRLRSGPPPDLILCDLMMPEMGGIDVLGQVRTDHPELVQRFVFATGGTLSSTARRDTERLGIEVVRKPFDIPELRRQLLARVEGDPTQ